MLTQHCNRRTSSGAGTNIFFLDVGGWRTTDVDGMTKNAAAKTGCPRRSAEDGDETLESYNNIVYWLPDGDRLNKAQTM